MENKQKHMPKVRTKELVVMAFLSAVLLAVQVALAPIPNIELVSLLIYIYSQIYRKKVFFIIYVFVLLEGCVYGFGIWWMGYLYVWSVLAIAALMITDSRQQKSPALSCLILGAYGLLYGFLFSIPYFAMLGWNGGVAYWVSGIPFDLIHCAGNIAAALLLYKPLYSLIRWLNCRSVYS